MNKVFMLAFLFFYRLFFFLPKYLLVARQTVFVDYCGGWLFKVWMFRHRGLHGPLLRDRC